MRRRRTVLKRHDRRPARLLDGRTDISRHATLLTANVHIDCTLPHGLFFCDLAVSLCDDANSSVVLGRDWLIALNCLCERSWQEPSHSFNVPMPSPDVSTAPYHSSSVLSSSLGHQRKSRPESGHVRLRVVCGTFVPEEASSGHGAKGFGVHRLFHIRLSYLLPLLS